MRGKKGRCQVDTVLASVEMMTNLYTTFRSPWRIIRAGDVHSFNFASTIFLQHGAQVIDMSTDCSKLQRLYKIRYNRASLISL